MDSIVQLIPIVLFAVYIFFFTVIAYILWLVILALRKYLNQ